MQILVTGGAGFIGSNFARMWVEDHPGDGVVVYDALTYAGNLANLAPYLEGGRLELVHGDIANLELLDYVLSSHHIAAIVNFAAESHNSLAVLDPARFFRTNVLGTQALCEAARRAGVERLHHVSTCEVYGDLALDSAESFHEDSPYRPRTPYNASKAAADHVVRSYGETFGLSFTITNCANNYGPYQFPEKVLPLFTTRAIDGETLPIYQSSDHRREWIHVADHCRAIELVLARGRSGETYHVGTGREASVMEIADAVLDATGRPASLKTIVADRPGHDRRYLLDSTKIRRELGWAPHVGFEEGIAATVRWYLDNEPWWRPLVGRSPVVEGIWEGGLPAPAGAASSPDGRAGQR